MLGDGLLVIFAGDKVNIGGRVFQVVDDLLERDLRVIDCDDCSFAEELFAVVRINKQMLNENHDAESVARVSKVKSNKRNAN